MAERWVSVTGLPPSINNVKLKPRIEKRIGSPGCLKSVKRDGDNVIFTFKDLEGYQKFRNAQITEIEFGMKKYPIMVYMPPFSPEPPPETPPQSPEPDMYGKPPTAETEPQLVQKVEKFSADLQNKLYSTRHSWSSLEHLPAAGGTMCLVACNIDPSTSIQKIMMHFESNKRARGGPVAGIINMIDGLLVVFMMSSDCESCLEMADQRFEGKKLKIFPKKIPGYYERKFVIEGVAQNTSQDTLIMYLERCTRDEICPNECLKQDLPGVYLVDYGEDFDTSETDEFLRKIKSRPLEGSFLQAKFLLKSDCLKIDGVQKDVSNDKIGLVLESRKRSGGGPVTKIDRLENNAALVYFSFCEDAERVCKTANVIINEHPVSVSLYYHSLAKDHEKVLKDFEPKPAPRSGRQNEGGKQPLQPYEFEPKCSEKLLDFIFGRDKHLQILHSVFEKFAAIEVIRPTEEDKLKRLKFSPKKVLSDKSQEQFEKNCETSFENHVKKYSEGTQRFESTKLAKARSLKLYPQIEIDYTGHEGNGDLEVCWKADEPVVEVIGIKTSVDHMLEHIANCVSSSVTTRLFGETQFGVLVHCGIITDLRDKYKNLQIRYDSNDFSVTFIGQDADITAAQIDALSAMSIEKKKLSGLNENVLMFLSHAMEKSGEVMSKIQAKLKQNSVKALFVLDENEPYLKPKTKEDFKIGAEVIRQYITSDVMKADDKRSKVMNSPEWKDFQQSFSHSELCKIYAKSDGSIILVGLHTETKIVWAKIKTFLSENEAKRFFMSTQYGKAKFVVEKSKEFSEEMCEKENITCGISPEANGGIFVEGKKAALDRAHPEMRKLLGSIIEDTLTLEKPGIKEYYNGKAGKQFLAHTERMCNCIVLTEFRNNPEWDEYNKKHGFLAQSKSKSSSVDLQEERLSSVTLANSSVTLSVWRTDISMHKVDAIVNASNENLRLLPSGVSGIIKKYDEKNGNQIQKEMDDLMKKYYGNLLPGEAVMTTAGNIPGCKKIVHACGPRWNAVLSYSSTDPKLILKACISRSLGNLEEERLKSIAIPAISCGVFGGKVPVCIPLIVDAVEEYFQEEKKSSIREVHFVENSKQDVLDEFVHCLKKFGPSTMDASSPQRKTPVKLRDTPAPASGGMSSLQQGSCSVVLIHGDIADQKADVIVNVTDPRNLTNMMSGPVISKVLGAKAGPNVQQEVSVLPGPHNVGDVFETNGGGLSCQKLYHALVTYYNASQDQASSSVIQTILQTSLDMADKAGFKSIVFPAIATGGFRYPPNLIAKLMRQEINSFTGNTLREVIILLHPQNPIAIQAFDAEFKSGNPVNQAASSTPPARRINFIPHKHLESPSSPIAKSRKSMSRAEKPKKSGKSTFEKIDDSSAHFGNVIASIEHGDITEQDCDVIVNSTNARFDLSQGMVSRQILRKGGRIIQDEATESGSTKKKDCDFVVTTAGRLQCEKIIHLVTPQNPKDLQKKIIKVLAEVEKLGLKHVCMPAFGTGNLHMEVDEVASIMQGSIDQFVKSQSRLQNLENVTIVIFDNNIIQKFKTGFFTPKKGFLERWFGWKVTDFWSESSTSSSQGPKKEEDDFVHLPQSPTSLNLFFYTTSKEDIKQAKSLISDEVSKVVHRAIIEENAIDRLTDWDVHDILKSGEKHNVQITQRSDRYLHRLILEGLTKDVMQAQEEIKDVLREFSAAETCAVYVTWQKKTATKQWEDYHPRSAQILEKAYKARTNGRGGVPDTVKVQEFEKETVTEHTVDLSLLDQPGKSPQVKRRIKERSITDIPDYWDDMTGKHLVMVPLQQSSQEYQNVLAKFQLGPKVFQQSIISIERVQNVSLYKQYAAKKAEVTGKLKNFTGQIERELFHGTSDDDKIIQNGFDRSYAGKNNILYGRGVYFATDPGFSHGYAAPNPQGHRKMFLANVITGEFCIGNQNMVAPPARTNSTVKNDLYDSTVNNATNPTIFVIYKDASAYPTYLMTYT